MNRYARARVAWSISYIQKISSANNRLIIIGDNVYDISSYFNSRVRFLGPSVEALFSNFYGTDATKQWLQITRTDPKSPLYFQCINNLFYIGTVDNRNSLKCQISNYLLLSFTILLVSVIVCKFLAAIRCGYQGDPEQCDKFVIVLVPCYTESFESIQNTLDSILSLDYDSTRKFLFIVADGLVTGSGNDIPTPEIILQVLDLEPDSQIRSDAFESIGEGELKINRGIVYSGLFMKNGKSIPFIFVIKIGNGKEPTRPGNRGKRDSQMILMRLLSRIHYNQAMNPLERTLCNKFQQLGYNPGLFEYLLMVDADTIVNTTALTHLISSMVHDVQVMGICGETLILNDRDSWVTMIQVYEYFISHHLSKSFESMFGAVTCLPGCFCMYRIKQTQKRQSTPILISHRITSAYSESNINTLHLKNLLQLGEDRYLTTLMLKNFPRLKLRFNGMATCWTVVPDQWRVLLSQRRRWINSTVHNLFDLLSVEQLCGCCVFSMRFVILLDLFSTVVQPAGLLYIIYIIYSIVIQSDVLPVVSIVMLSAAYGLQALIFVTKRAWAQIGWMIIYVLAMPIIGFFVPLYSFWHFDDFTWGNTRQVEEEEETSFEPESVTEGEMEMIKWQWNGTLSEFGTESDKSIRYTHNRVGKSPEEDEVMQDEEIMKVSEEEMKNELRSMMREYDLSQKTRKEIRDLLSARYGSVVQERKEAIDMMITSIAQGH
ncbi:chitin synthase-domain-containing protein [Globomyces pollinis-pini]|nr:chitin synthase-domain-containing protein [Globomyces pollinis-pini]